MRRTVLIEGIFLLFISLVSMAEGLRLIIQRDPRKILDVLGPGYYVLFLGTGLMITGAVHLILNYKKNLNIVKVEVDKKMGIRMISMLVVLAIYVYLISIVGYLVATIIFFLLEFKLVGVKLWPTNIILSIIITAVYYIVFVHYCSLIFPRGIFFR